MPGKRTLLLVAIVVVSVGLGILVGTSTRERDAAKPGPYDHLGGDFTLQSAAGPVSLADLRGKVVPIYFGFTHCPDICPTTLQRLGKAIDSLSTQEQADVHGLFITIDPERDSAARMDAYTRHFSDRVTGLSGSLAEIDAVAKQYLVIFSKVALADSAMGYTMDHSSRIYVIGRDGRIKAMVHHGEEPESIAGYLRDALKLSG